MAQSTLKTKKSHPITPTKKQPFEGTRRARYSISSQDGPSEDGARWAGTAAWAGLPISAADVKDESFPAKGPTLPEGLSTVMSNEIESMSEQKEVTHLSTSLRGYIHEGPTSRLLCARLGAPAFSVGEHVFSAEPITERNNPRARALLAHEMAHVSQNRRQGESQTIQRADPVEFYSPDDAKRLAALVDKGMTDYKKAGKDLLWGVNIGAFGLNKKDYFNITEASKNLIKSGAALQSEGKGFIFDDDDKIENGKKMVALGKAYKSMVDNLINAGGDLIENDKHLSDWKLKSHEADAAFKYISVALDFAALLDQHFETSNAYKEFMKNPTEDFEAALSWASECGALLGAAGSVISHFPPPFGQMLSAPFKIPSKAIAAYSNIIINYVVTLDSMTGGASVGAKLESLDGSEALHGEVIPLARGAAHRGMSDVSSIIWGPYREQIDAMPLAKAKWFIGQQLAQKISDGYGRGIGEAELSSLIEQRRYVTTFE